MKIVLVTGGARAGKSRWAEREATRLAGDDVAVIATAEPGDTEMVSRIAAHRAARPSGWTTLEAPILVAEALAAADAPVVLLDCMTLWVSNLLLADLEAAVEPGSIPDPVAPAETITFAADPAARVQERVEALVAAADRRDGTLLVVTNEVGLGVVPGNVLARTYRDLLGWTNARIARDAERVLLLVAGIPVSIR